MYRDPLEIVESLHVRDNIPVVVGISLWEQYIASALSAAMDMPRIFVHYSEIMSNPVHATQRIYNELVYNGVTGLSMPSEEVITDFVDPALYRSKPMVAKDLQLTMFQETLKACASGQASLFSKVEKTPVSHAYLEIYKYIHADRETIKKLREDIRDANFKITASEQHVLELKNSLQKAKDAGDELSKKLSESEQYLHDANTLIQKQNERLNYIYTTLWWKLGSGIAKVLRAARLR